jgi:AraC-like DNA-binding protein
LRARRRKQRKLRQEKFVEWAGKSHQDFRKKLEVNPSEVTITPLDEQFLQKAIKLVEDQMGNADLTVEMLGQQLGMSRSFLYKKLMAVTGLGPSEFIRTIRIKRGMALLERSQMQITEIAYAVGFNSLKSFTMNFKAEYGITPSEYLKNTKKQQEKT